MASTLTREEFSVRISRVYPSLLSHARRSCGQDAEDVVGDCMLHATRAFASFIQPDGDNGGSFVNWVHKILSNAMSDYHRKNERRRGSEVSYEEMSEAQTTGWELRWAAMECHSEREILNDVEMIADARLRMRLAELTEEETTCFGARLNGEKLRETARRLGLSKPTICRRIQSAVEKIKNVAGVEIGQAPDLDKYQWKIGTGCTIYHSPPSTGSMLAKEKLDAMRPVRLSQKRAA